MRWTFTAAQHRLAEEQRARDRDLALWKEGITSTQQKILANTYTRDDLERMEEFLIRARQFAREEWYCNAQKAYLGVR